MQGGREGSSLSLEALAGRTEPKALLAQTDACWTHFSFQWPPCAAFGFLLCHMVWPISRTAPASLESPPNPMVVKELMSQHLCSPEAANNGPASAIPEAGRQSVRAGKCSHPWPALNWPLTPQSCPSRMHHLLPLISPSRHRAPAEWRRKRAPGPIPSLTLGLSPLGLEGSQRYQVSQLHFPSARPPVPVWPARSPGEPAGVSTQTAGSWSTSLAGRGDWPRRKRADFGEGTSSLRVRE